MEQCCDNRAPTKVALQFVSVTNEKNQQLSGLMRQQHSSIRSHIQQLGITKLSPK
jgi:hypothetical protein